jgi:signal transduction histidine kinase
MNPASVLIVDDRPENLLALEAILGGRGLTLVRANSGREALKAMLAHEFALVLLDIAMPELDGYETAELIRRNERFRLTPIIFLTANHQAEAHVFRGYSVGAVDYLLKPLVPEVLLSKVNVFVEVYHNRQMLREQAAELRQAYDEMEQRVLERTSDLAASNGALQAEVAERQRVESERAALLEREQAARLEAEAMNRLKDEFLATLSHELRTPLNAILGWTHLLESGKRDDAIITRAIRVIKNSAQAQAQLVTHILDVSRIIGGKLPLHIAEVDLCAVISNTLETLQPATTAKGISIQARFEGPTRLNADPDRLQQVMWNLLSNAIKFTPKGGLVRVDATATAHEVRITVADNGSGIDAAFLPRVFERFTQADASQTRAHGGLGLGLAIVRHLVELHGGLVGIESPGKNHGTRVTVVLPIRDMPGPTADSGLGMPKVSSAVPPQPVASLEGVSVLIVDDEEDARDVLTLILQDRGAQVTAVGSAAAALDSIHERIPDVLVSDIGMPGEDGHTLLRKLRSLRPEQGGRVPAVALTAYATSADSARALAAGFDRHVCKPVTSEEIIDAVAVMAARPK